MRGRTPSDVDPPVRRPLLAAMGTTDQMSEFEVA